MPCNAPELFSGFSKLPQATRFRRLLEMGALTKEEITFLQSGGVKDLGLAENFIENVIGYFQLPLGVASYFRIDEKDYAIPMAVEETSIIAALSKSAKWIRSKGKITTEIKGQEAIGQIQIARVKDYAKLTKLIEERKSFLIELVNEDVASGLVQRGGGVKDITIRELKRPDNDTMAVIHLYVDCCDAMGANIINQILEFLKTPIENLSGETVTMCILSNLADSKITKATVTINEVPDELGNKIAEAALFAQIDPYRATTHNKGVLNGIDPVLIATGNDWRAVEAAVHAYAARSGQYRSITDWQYHNGTLTGTLEAPICVGIVGGVTKLHPTAQLCLNMLDIQSADELSRVVATVGLVQNLGAIRALTTDGIIQGHMKLHINNLVMNTDATETEAVSLKSKLEYWLKTNKRVSLQIAKEMLQSMRSKQKTSSDVIANQV